MLVLADWCKQDSTGARPLGASGFWQRRWRLACLQQRSRSRCAGVPTAGTRLGMLPQRGHQMVVRCALVAWVDRCWGQWLGLLLGVLLWLVC